MYARATPAKRVAYVAERKPAAAVRMASGAAEIPRQYHRTGTLREYCRTERYCYRDDAHGLRRVDAADAADAET